MTDEIKAPDLSLDKVMAHVRAIRATGLDDHFVYVCMARDDLYGGVLRYTRDEVAKLIAAGVRFAVAEQMPRGQYAVSSKRPGKKSYGPDNFEVTA